MASNSGGQLTYVNSQPPPLEAYHLRGSGATATLTGIFLDSSGKQLGSAITTSITTSTTVNLLGLSVDKNAVGFLGRLSGSAVSMGVFLDSAANAVDLSNDFATNTTNYPLLGTGTLLAFGYVSPSVLSQGSGAAGFLPAVRPKITVTPTMDTSAYAAGDIWFDSTAVANISRATDEPGILVGIQVQDKDDQTAAAGFLLLLDANNSLGTINSAPSISDANATNIIAVIPFASTDWLDVGGCKTLTVQKQYLPGFFYPASGTRTLYIAGITSGSPTQTASGIVITLFVQDAQKGV